jgi:hypothetical protein
MNARLLFLAVAGLLALTAVPASAQVPAGTATYKVFGGLATSKARYFAPSQQVVVRGRVKPAVPGEVLTLYAIRGKKATKKVRRKVANGGRFEFKFKVGNPGGLRLAIKHAASPAQAAFRTKPKRISVVAWQAGVGDKGVKVLLLQRALLHLGFATPVSGVFDDGTARGVLAFRKTNNLGREGFASKQVYAMLARGRGAFKLRFPKAGKHVEFDWSRQVIVLAQRGKPYRTYHTSSGKAATPTIFGTFKFYLKTPGTNSHGMVYSNYFIRGYAIHGYASVPTYPASHGCLRIPIPNAIQVFNWIDIGNTIFSYR